MKKKEWLKLSEEQLEKKLEQISDKIELQIYEKDDVVNICKELLLLNLESYNYVLQEQILYTLCNALAFYDVRKQLELYTMKKYKQNIAQGLEEYIDEILGE